MVECCIGKIIILGKNTQFPMAKVLTKAAANNILFQECGLTEWPEQNEAWLT